ncbi:hypothetical protein B6236_05460 [Mycobacterium tuberculosis]|nr:hypothetical protein B6236_05460 [Mycobacterium tuberculosis]
MQPYGQYCPVARAAELLGDRWTLLIVRELLFGPLRFTEIERACPASPARCWPSGYADFSTTASSKRSPNTRAGAIGSRWPARSYAPCCRPWGTGSPVG